MVTSHPNQTKPATGTTPHCQRGILLSIMHCWNLPCQKQADHAGKMNSNQLSVSLDLRSRKLTASVSCCVVRREIEWFRQDAKDNFPAFETSKAQAVLETQQKDFDADSFGAF